MGTFARSGAERVTIATALDRAGYRTGLFGKYLNDYDSAPAGYVPLDGIAGSRSRRERRVLQLPDVRQRGRARFHGSAPADYSTDVIAGKAIQFIRTTPAMAVLPDGDPVCGARSMDPRSPAPPRVR